MMNVQMRKTAQASAAFGLLVLTGCIELPGESASGAPATPTQAEQSCLLAITNTTNNPDVRLIDSSFSQAGTLVRAAVGEQNAVWQCIAYSDGSTAGVEFTGSEGTL